MRPLACLIFMSAKLQLYNYVFLEKHLRRRGSMMQFTEPRPPRNLQIELW